METALNSNMNGPKTRGGAFILPDLLKVKQVSGPSLSSWSLKMSRKKGTF